MGKFEAPPIVFRDPTFLKLHVAGAKMTWKVKIFIANSMLTSDYCIFVQHFTLGWLENWNLKNSVSGIQQRALQICPFFHQFLWQFKINFKIMNMASRGFWNDLEASFQTPSTNSSRRWSKDNYFHGRYKNGWSLKIHDQNRLQYLSQKSKICIISCTFFYRRTKRPCKN